jgi:hypothetical protein
MFGLSANVTGGIANAEDFYAAWERNSDKALGVGSKEGEKYKSSSDASCELDL